LQKSSIKIFLLHPQHKDPLTLSDDLSPHGLFLQTRMATPASKKMGNGAFPTDVNAVSARHII